jgi:hypothetical protein
MPWARLLVGVRSLQHEVVAMRLGDDLQTAWKTLDGQTRAN